MCAKGREEEEVCELFKVEGKKAGQRSFFFKLKVKGKKREQSFFSV